MKTWSLCALGAALLLGPIPTPADAAALAGPIAGNGEPASATPLAINMDEFEDWNPTWVFVDAFKESRDWLVQTPGSTNPFQIFGEDMPLTTDGWPVPPPGRAAGALLKREQGGNFPGGVYNVFWEGTGELDFFYDATEISYDAANRRAQILVQPSGSGLLVQLHHVNPGDPVRNVRVIMPGFENTYQTEPFHPLFLERLEPFGALRFMQWHKTNTTTQQFWHERPTKNYYSQSTDDGMAIEWMIELANHSGKAPWFNIPHLADDNYIREFARLVRDNLDPGIPVYVEWSNEVWNEIYPAWEYAKNNAFSLGLHSWGGQGAEYIAAWKYTAYRSVQMFDIWRQEFQSAPGGPNRVVRVLPTQDANPAVGETILQQVVNGQPAGAQADVLAGAPYLGVDFGQPEEQYNTLAKSIDQIFSELYAEIYNERVPVIQQNVANAQGYGLDYIAYEGGQHLVGVGSAIDNQNLTNLFHDISRDYRMYDLYQEYMDEWHKAGGGSLALFTYCGRYTLHGSWGALEYQDQPEGEAHKWRSMRDYDQNFNGGGHGGPVTPEVEPYGNPCGGTWISHYGTPSVGGSGFGISLSGGEPWSQALLTLANQNQSWLGLPLPFDLGVIEMWGCNVLVGEGLRIPAAANGSGAASLNIDIPPFAPLAGQEFFFQWLTPKNGVNPANFAVTQALRVKVGS